MLIKEKKTNKTNHTITSLVLKFKLKKVIKMHLKKLYSQKVHCFVSRHNQQLKKTKLSVVTRLVGLKMTIKLSN